MGGHLYSNLFAMNRQVFFPPLLSHFKVLSVCVRGCNYLVYRSIARSVPSKYNLEMMKKMVDLPKSLCPKVNLVKKQFSVELIFSPS